MADNIQTQKVICQGGLFTSDNNLLLSDTLPGSATKLINYEVSLAGGYRRINGYSKFDATYYNVDDTAAEGPILGLAMYKTDAGVTEYFAARKQKSGTTYNWYKFASGTGWVAQTTGLTLNTVSGSGRALVRIRHDKYNFGAGNQIIFADGCNNLSIYDGTSWYAVDPAATGADLANAGGATALAAPSFVTVFENHIFAGGCCAYLSTIAHCAPRTPQTWTSAAGGGQIIASREVIMMKSFRESNYLFSEDAIQKIVVSGSDFVINDVTSNIGCVAPDSIIELGGDLIFLAPDGFRPVAGTAKIGDIEINSISKPIQLLTSGIIANYDLSTMNAVVLRTKSQARFFFGGTTKAGIIGGLRTGDGGQASLSWEWGQLLGIEAHVSISDFVLGKEVVLHGDLSGNVYTQESGNSFDGGDILSLYSPPYLDQGDTEVRKKYRSVSAFCRPEGDFTLQLGLNFNWGDDSFMTPSDYSALSLGVPSEYGALLTTYGVATYDGAGSPKLDFDIEGEEFSIRPNFVTLGTDVPHSIQGFILTITPEGRT